MTEEKYVIVYLERVFPSLLSRKAAQEIIDLWGIPEAEIRPEAPDYGAQARTENEILRMFGESIHSLREKIASGEYSSPEELAAMAEICAAYGK